MTVFTGALPAVSATADVWGQQVVDRFNDLDAGSVSRGLVPVNVRDYGATGNGTTDDRAAIQAALDAAGAGKSVYFPPGTYLLTTATIAGDRILKVYPDQALLGAGGNVSTLKVGATFGDYRAVIGLLNASTYCGRFSISRLGFDQNAVNGNALNVASLATYPRYAVIAGSYTAGSSVTVTECSFRNGDTVNVIYVYGDVLDISRNHFVNQGGPVGTASHDSSSVYTTTTVAGGVQRVSGNLMRGVSGSGGSRTAIETHGGSQTVAGNTITGYYKGVNLTGVGAGLLTDGIGCTNNVVSGCAVGVHVWSYYAGALTSGTNLRNVVVAGNNITIDRGAWNAIGGLTAYASGVLVDVSNTAPVEGLAVVDNNITYLPDATTAPASDYHSAGITIDITATAAEVRDLRILGNSIVNPLSCGMLLAATIKRGMVKNNIVVDPGQSVEATVVTAYRSFALLGRTLADVGFESNTLIDTRGTHYAEYGVIAAGTLTAATNCWTRNNTVRYLDGATPRCFFTPSSAAGTAFRIDEVAAVASPPGIQTKAGSTIVETTTGKVFTQTVAPTGTTWAATGPAVPVTGIAPDVQVFTASGTWTKPAGALLVQAVAVAGGGGGGAGRRGAAATVRNGGGGGAGGSVTARAVAAGMAGTTETVTVGSGGGGGAAQTVDSTDGAAGAAGGTSSFGAHVRALAGSAGSGGTATNGLAGTGGGGGFPGSNGAAASTTGGVGATGITANGGAGGGGSGGGVTSGDVAAAGGAGSLVSATGRGNAAAGAVNTGGGAAVDSPVSSGEPGGGGAGGGGSITGTAGAGSAGALYGGGGGGGGASLNGNNSGAGGSGAAGIVVVVSQ